MPSCQWRTGRVVDGGGEWAATLESSSASTSDRSETTTCATDETGAVGKKSLSASSTASSSLASSRSSNNNSSKYSVMKAGASAALNIASATAVSEGAAKSLDVLRKRTLGRRSGSDKSVQLEEKQPAMLPMSELKSLGGDESALHTSVRSVSPSVRNSVSSMQSMDSVSDGDDIHRGIEMTDDEDDDDAGGGGGSHRFLKTPQLK